MVQPDGGLIRHQPSQRLSALRRFSRGFVRQARLTPTGKHGQTFGFAQPVEFLTYFRLARPQLCPLLLDLLPDPVQLARLLPEQLKLLLPRHDLLNRREKLAGSSHNHPCPTAINPYDTPRRVMLICRRLSHLLPRVTGAPHADAGSQSMMQPEARRVLVAESDSPLARLLALVLEDEGYQVSTATSIDEACTQLAANTFDLLLCDSFSSDHRQALTASSAIRQAAGSMPAVLLTGHTVERGEALATGFLDVLSKPFDFDDLLRCVQRLLSEAGGQAPASCGR
jgi:CheY-like chemotaxis protein